MKPIQRFLIGGIGGMAPILMFLANVDFDKYFVDIITLRLIGYLVRVAILFLIGGFTAYLYKDEKNHVKIFQLGMAAPALVAGYINTASLPTHINTTSVPRYSSILNIMAPSMAYAQTEVQHVVIKKYTLPYQSKAKEFWEGLSGRQSENIWFVITGSFLNSEDAVVEAKRINLQFPDFKAEIYDKYKDDPYYTVVIGAHLTQEQAKKLRDKAIKSGLRKDTFYSSPPNLPPAPEP
jgi:hypothetical protein